MTYEGVQYARQSNTPSISQRSWYSAASSSAGASLGVEDVGDQPVAVLHRRGRVVQRVVDDAHDLARAALAVLAVEDGAEVRAVAEHLFGRQLQVGLDPPGQLGAAGAGRAATA